MGKWVSTAVLDGALSRIASADAMIALAAQPATYAAAVAEGLASAVLTPEDFRLEGSGETGRRVEIAAKSGVAVLAAGTASHVALVRGDSAELLYVTTCPVQPLASGGTVSFSPWTVELGAAA